MSFLRDYLKFCENTESPELFHTWSAMSAISSMAGRRFWFDLGLVKIYANLYVLLVGEPGSKKTTAMYVAKDLIRQINDIPISPTQETKEALAQAMTPDDSKYRRIFTRKDTGKPEEYTQCAIFATEFTHYIAVNSLGWIDFLTTIYDEAIYEVKTKGKGNDFILGPYITMLGCMTPELMGQMIKASIVSGGFSRRTIFVWGFPSSKFVPIPHISDESKLAMERCVHHGRLLQKESGAFVFENEAAKQWYIDWYGRHKAFIATNTVKCMSPFYESRSTMLFKVAMLIALSESFTRHISVAYLQAADAMLSDVERDMPNVFSGSGPNPSAGVAADIQRQLELAAKPMSWRILFTMFYSKVDKLDFENILSALQYQDQIIIWTEQTEGPRGVLLTRYVASKNVYNDYMPTYLSKGGKLG